MRYWKPWRMLLIETASILEWATDRIGDYLYPDEALIHWLEPGERHIQEEKVEQAENTKKIRRQPDGR